MNIKQLSSLTAIGAIAFGSATPALSQSNAASKITFSCEINNGVPTTVLQAEDTQKVIFNWQSERFASSNNPVDLCNDVSAKLNDYSAQKSDLSVLTFKGFDQGGLPAICATDDLAACEMKLFTLSKAEQPVTIADQILKDILAKDLQATRIVSNDRGLQSVSHSIDIWELILGRKLIKTL